MHRLYIFFMLITTRYVTTVAFKDNIRTYAGIDANTEKYPYIVALKAQYSSQHIATGALLTPQWVLSAAHCLKKAITHVQYGDMSIPLNFTDSKSKVLQMIQHPRYNRLMSNDIGLLAVNPITMVKYAKLSGLEYQTLNGLSGEYAEFGMIYFPSGKTNRKQQYIQLDEHKPLVLGNAILRTCREPFTSNLICVSSKCAEKEIKLPGNSGGPLIVDNKIVGIALAADDKLHIQAFTPISSYLTWMVSIILPTQNEDKTSTVSSQQIST